MQKYIIQYPSICQTRAEFIINLFLDLKEVQSKSIKNTEIRTIIKGIRKLLRGEIDFKLN